MAAISFDANDGLPSSETYDLLQDRQGFIWIATDNGISRFNGYEFQSFGPEQGLLDPVVFTIFEDHEGKIWMSTLSGNLYYYENDTILPYQHNAILERQISTPKNPVVLKFFFIDEAGTFHGAAQKIGIIKIRSDGTVERFHPTSTDCNSLL
ncbi:MAG: two-component regulator propeller domain-containing protein, partial [Bacteroidota bacterium]